MAPVLARLVRSLAMLSLAGGIAIVVHSCIWATLCFTEVREHGLTAVTHPERVLEHGESAAVPPDAPGTIVSVKPAAQPAAAESVPESAPSAAEFKPQSRADSFLAFLTAASTVVGVASLALLPIVLLVAFITSLVRAPRAANASMGGILWALFAFGLVLPWSAFWPQVPWSGLFNSYAGLIAETTALKAAGSPFTLAAFFCHVVVPGAAIAVLVGLAWRCGEPLHAELLAAEALLVDPEIDRDATAAVRKGPTAAMTRNAASLALATADVGEDEAVSERPRRLI